MTKGLLHCCTGVLARVYVRVCSERGVHSMGVLGATASRCVLSTGVLDITIHICNKITAGSAHALVPVCKVCSFVLGDKDGGVQLVYVEHSSFGEGAYF